MAAFGHSKFLRVTSRDRSSKSNSQYDILFTTRDVDLHQIKRVELKTAIIPNTQYNVNINNNTWNFINSANGGTNYTIPVGQYTVTSLITELESQVPGLTVTQSTLTDKLSFTMSSGTFTMESDRTINKMAEVLGVSTTVAGASGTEVCDSLPNLTGLTNVYIASSALSSGASMIASENDKTSIFCSVPITVPYGSTQVHDESGSDTHDYTSFPAHKNISNIDIQLLDDKGFEVDLNGLEYEFIFRVYS